MFGGVVAVIESDEVTSGAALVASPKSGSLAPDFVKITVAGFQVLVEALAQLRIGRKLR